MATLNIAVDTAAQDGRWSSDGGSFSSGTSQLYIGVVGVVYHMYGRLNNVTIPKGATITAAWGECTADGSGDGSPTARWHLEAVDNATTEPTNFTEAEAMARTTAFSATKAVGYQAGALSTSESMTAVVQEVVDRAGWVSGNAMRLIVRRFGANAYASIAAYEHPTYDPLLLHVEYTVPLTAQPVGMVPI